MDELLKYIFPKYADKRVEDENSFRIKIAKEQLKKYKFEKIKILEICQEYFKLIGMENIKIIKYQYDVNINRIKRGFYSNIKNDNNLADKNDIIWLKFTTDGFLGVVATSADINLNENCTSGKIISALCKKWDKEIIIFPLQNIPKDLNRQRIESGLGNYLISKGVPILDYFSHNL